MNVFLDLAVGTLTQGLIYSLISFGIYITYKILDFPDLSVDGSFPLGAAVTAVLLTRGMDPFLTLPVAMLTGALAGLCTGLIHVKVKVRDLLAGIITMTALFSINLQIAGSNLTVDRGTNTIFTAPLTMRLLGGMPLSGGMRSKISAALVGTFTYVILANGLILSGVSTTLIYIIKAIVFMAVILMICRKKDGVLPR